MTLASAYRRARRVPAPSFALQTAAPVRPYRGESYVGPDDGKGAAAYALKRARANVAAFRDARAEYEDSAVARDAALLTFRDAKAAAASLAHKGGPAYEAAAREVTERVAAFDMAERRHAAALKETARTRRLCEGGAADYGAGTWQGGAAEHESALPFSVAPAMRRDGRHGSGAMRAGDKGGQFFAYHDSGAVRNVRDAGDVARLDHTGWYDNPHGESARDGSGLIIGVVGQLRARDGRAVYVPGWRTGDDMQGGAQFDMRAAVIADGRDESDAEDAARDAARAADGMAETVAEAERDFAAAWGAGQAWAEAGERVAELRGEIAAILAERHKAKADAAALPALCGAIRDRVRTLLVERAEAMAERARLAEGDDSTWPFYPDRDARAAFCEGANVDSFPA